MCFSLRQCVESAACLLGGNSPLCKIRLRVVLVHSQLNGEDVPPTDVTLSVFFHVWIVFIHCISLITLVYIPPMLNKHPVKAVMCDRRIHIPCAWSANRSNGKTLCFDGLVTVISVAPLSTTGVFSCLCHRIVLQFVVGGQYANAVLRQKEQQTCTATPDQHRLSRSSESPTKRPVFKTPLQ